VDLRVICVAAIAPHGDLDAAPEIRTAMTELGRRFAAAAPEATIVVTPHNVHVEGHFAVVTAARVGPFEVDRALGAAALQALRGEGLPVLGVSYGGNDPAAAELPVDWGTEIPLEPLPPTPVVVVSPARDRPLEEHVRAGAALARATDGRRVALVASADHGHAHDPDGPYGYDPAAAAYDLAVQDIIRSGELAFEPLAETVEAAKADSLWQLLVLQGALGAQPPKSDATGGGDMDTRFSSMSAPLGACADVELLAYAAPTYYGMLVAACSVR
jgi:aromatic ring-opening dioxygenase LigB subunit